MNEDREDLRGLPFKSTFNLWIINIITSLVVCH